MPQLLYTEKAWYKSLTFISKKKGNMPFSIFSQQTFLLIITCLLEFKSFTNILCTYGCGPFRMYFKIMKYLWLIFGKIMVTTHCIFNEISVVIILTSSFKSFLILVFKVPALSNIRCFSLKFKLFVVFNVYNHILSYQCLMIFCQI